MSYTQTHYNISGAITSTNNYSASHVFTYNDKGAVIQKVASVVYNSVPDSNTQTFTYSDCN